MATDSLTEIAASRRQRSDTETNGDAHALSRLGQRQPDPVQRLASARHEFGEHGGVNMSIEASSTFTVIQPETLEKLFAGKLGPEMDFYIYSRHFNPTVLNVGRQLAALEGTEAAYCTASGMAAISAVILQLCNHGDHIVSSNRLYGGTHAFLLEFLPRATGVTTTFVDPDDIDAVTRAFTPRTKLLYVESISNPTLCVADIPALAAAAHAHDAKLVVDNTFAPMIISPARHGADVVVHSLTKFISGGADIIAGAICGSRALINDMMGLHQGALMLLGPTMDPHVAFKISERLPHLALRMAEHSRRTMEYATRLHKLKLRVIYPGLPDHPHHAVLARLANPGYGFGGILCLDLGSRERAHKLLDRLQNQSQFGFMAVSLGYHETLMSCPETSTSSELSADEQKLTGISAGLIRMSVGYSSSLEQRWSQLLDALVHLQLLPDSAANTGGRH